MHLKDVRVLGTAAILFLISPLITRAASPYMQIQTPRVGIYYFDGWADPTTANFHMHGLVGSFASREPLNGWYDNSAKSVHQHVAWARRAHINFFVFDWYDTSRDGNASDKTLNSALHLFVHDRQKLGMKFALLYVNNGPFSIPKAKWQAQCNAWVKKYFTNKNYERINGKPLLVVFSAGDMEKTWQGGQGVKQAWDTLQQTALQAGLPGVYVACCALPGPQFGWTDIGQLATEGYSSFTGYNYPGMSGTVKGSNPYSIIAKGSIDIFNSFADRSKLPYIPVVMTGWDPRPWNETDFWYRRSPAQVARLITSTLNWWLTTPRVRPISNRPLILLEAWNELGEGSYIVPTRGEAYSYLNATGKALATWTAQHCAKEH